VPIKAPVAGIAMAWIKEGDDYIVLTDIAGVEDHLGDMDVKVAAQPMASRPCRLDIKITGVDVRHPAGRAHRRPRLPAWTSWARWPRFIDAPRTGAQRLRAAHHHPCRSTRRRSAC